MKGRWPITLMCQVLQVSASGYFRWDACTRGTGHGTRRRHSDDALLVHIRAIHEQLRGEYGWPRMHRELLARGLRVGKERVRRLMQRHGIRAKGKRKFVVTTDSAHRLPAAPDLVQRRFTPAAPNVTLPRFHVQQEVDNFRGTENRNERRQAAQEAVHTGVQGGGRQARGVGRRSRGRTSPRRAGGDAGQLVQAWHCVGRRQRRGGPGQ